MADRTVKQIEVGVPATADRIQLTIAVTRHDGSVVAVDMDLSPADLFNDAFFAKAHLQPAMSALRNQLMTGV